MYVSHNNVMLQARMQLDSREHKGVWDILYFLTGGCGSFDEVVERKFGALSAYVSHGHNAPDREPSSPLPHYVQPPGM